MDQPDLLVGVRSCRTRTAGAVMAWSPPMTMRQKARLMEDAAQALLNVLDPLPQV
jgi:hypothetical protein